MEDRLEKSEKRERQVNQVAKARDDEKGTEETRRNRYSEVKLKD